VSLQVQGQVIRAGEGAIAHPALERPVARVLPHVTRQLVRTGKFPTALAPRADVGLLPRVRAQVGLQVARLGIRLAAARMVAGVGWQLAFESQFTFQRLLFAGQ